jgi:glycosyltransferase involved in cell wall biosynthesis
MNETRCPLKYSIIIPTRSKVEYLKYAIESVISIERDDYELIISNNYSTDNTEEYLKKFIGDRRIKIVQPPQALPMALHYEFCIAQSSGEWMTLLGDDDGLMPFIFDDMDKYTRNYPLIEIVSSERAYFFWKGSEDKYGATCVNYKALSKSSVRSTKKDFVMASLGLRSIFDLPMLYTTCFVKRELIERLKLQTNNNFYFSIIPDIFSGVRLSFSVNNYLRVYTPMFWVGTSYKSMSGSNKIYIDSELAKDGNERKISLHNNCSQDLHQLGYSPYYLLECFLQSNVRLSKFKLKLYLYIIYAGIINSLLYSIISGFNKKKLNDDLKIIKCNIKEKGLLLIPVYVSGFLLFVLKIFLKISEKVNLISSKKLTKFKSSDRKQYSDIIACNFKLKHMGKF